MASSRNRAWVKEIVAIEIFGKDVGGEDMGGEDMGGIQGTLQWACRWEPALLALTRVRKEHKTKRANKISAANYAVALL